MFFKNAISYTLSTIPIITNEMLDKECFHSCSSAQPMSGGFIKPFDDENYIEKVGDFVFMSYQVEEKMLPSSVINDALADSIAEIEEAENRNIGRKEKNAIKEELILSLLPKAFVKKRRTNAFIDLKNQILVVDAASETKAEEFCNALREAIGSLPCAPVTPKGFPADCMTIWVAHEVPAKISLEHYCKIEGRGDDSIAVYRNDDMTSENIIDRIKSGGIIIELAVSHNEAATFILNQRLHLRRISFSDLCMQSVSEQSEDDRYTEERASAFMSANTSISAILYICEIMSGNTDSIN